MKNSKNKNQICTYCIMDTTVPDIRFNAEGQCNLCLEHINRIRVEEEQYNQKSLNKLVLRIKKNKKNKKYDCVIGVSGGVDSTYTAYLVKEVLKLNPLAVHFDNGWNSELAVQNIKNCLSTLDIDLYTHVVDWNEFKDIQRSLILSSVKNIEMATDHAIVSLLIKVASQQGIRFILHGGNNATEGIMPFSWMETNNDKKVITSITKKFSNRKLDTLPTLSLIGYFYYLVIKRIKYIPLLNYFKYEKNDVIKILKEKINYQPYDSKHNESLITKFFQQYILPEKYNIDKRKAHYSNLIISNQINRAQALSLLKKELYNSSEFVHDKKFFLKKLNFTEDEFIKIMNMEPKDASDYPSNIKYINFVWLFISIIRRFTR